MEIRRLTDKEEIFNFLKQEIETHYYETGDLDPFFWPYTTWYGWYDDQNHLLELALLYDLGDFPVLLVHGNNAKRITAFLQELASLLPQKMYSHLSPGGYEGLQQSYTAESYGKLYQMVLKNPTAAKLINTAGTEALTLQNLDELKDFFDRSYPGNWFTPRMLESGHFYGYRENGNLLSAAGIHVYSPEYKIAALGNITTLPEARGKGLAVKTTARLCQELLKSVKTIGLNVHIENEKAIKTYQAIGFEQVATYEEFMMTRK